MSQIKREMERLERLQHQAVEVAKQAKAVKECEHPGHSEYVIDQFDGDAASRAYAIGTNLWKSGDVDGTREEFMDAIKGAIEMAPSECPECERMMAKDD